MAQGSAVSRLVGNIVAVLAVGIGGAFLIDIVLGWFGAPPVVLCSIFVPLVLTFSYTPAIVLGTIGFAVWALQGFKGGSGGAMLGGAFIIGLVPMLLPHYLGTSGVCPV